MDVTRGHGDAVSVDKVTRRDGKGRTVGGVQADEDGEGARVGMREGEDGGEAAGGDLDVVADGELVHTDDGAAA